MGLVPNSDLISTLTGLVASMLTGTKVHLYTVLANVLGPGTVLADFTEPTYAGYAAKSATFGAPYIDSNGNAASDSPLVQFQPTGSTGTDIILGWYVTDTAGTTLLFCGSLPTPVSLGTPADALPLVLQYKLAPPGPPY